MTRAPNLDSWDKLVKRGQTVVWFGYRAKVQRVRTGRCLVKFIHVGRMPTWADVATRWLPCSSVTVVTP